MRLCSDTVLRWNEGEKERKHEGKRIMIVFYALLQMSCVGYYTTAENGYRLKDPGDFKYSKPKFIQEQSFNRFKFNLRNGFCLLQRNR